jgi:hypothetical protein
MKVIPANKCAQVDEAAAARRVCRCRLVPATAVPVIQGAEKAATAPTLARGVAPKQKSYQQRLVPANDQTNRNRMLRSSSLDRFNETRTQS